MAWSLEQIRGQIITSIFGRRLGLDKDDVLCGPHAVRLPIEDITTTNASTMAAFGITRLMSTPVSSATYTMATVPQGSQKIITQISSSTLGFVVRPNNQTFATTAGSSFNQMVSQGAGGAIQCWAISSGVLAVDGTPHTNVVFSTY